MVKLDGTPATPCYEVYRSDRAFDVVHPKHRAEQTFDSWYDDMPPAGELSDFGFVLEPETVPGGTTVAEDEARETGPNTASRLGVTFTTPAMTAFEEISGESSITPRVRFVDGIANAGDNFPGAYNPFQDGTGAALHRLRPEAADGGTWPRQRIVRRQLADPA